MSPKILKLLVIPLFFNSSRIQITSLEQKCVSKCGNKRERRQRRNEQTEVEKEEITIKFTKVRTILWQQ